MSTAALLLGYAAVLLGVTRLSVQGTDWTARAPRLGIWVWQAVTTSLVLSVVLAGLAVTVPTVPVSTDLADMLHACVAMLRARYETPGGTAMAATGSVLAAAVAGRTLWCLVSALWRARRQRAHHAQALALVGTRRPDLGVTVLPDARPAAYCLPGFGHRVVLTSAALTALEPKALAAVIAHERAHIRGRHHLVLAYADALARAFPRVAFFGIAAAETRQLVEMAADDAATTCTDGPLTLAGALLELAGAGAPAASLAAGGEVGHRIRRLIGVRRPLTRFVAWSGAVAAVSALALPLVLAAQPAIAAGMDACPLPEVAVAAAPAG